MMYHPSISFRF